MGDSEVKQAQEKAKKANVAEMPASSFMTRKVISVRVGHSIKATIKMFHTHKVSGAPVLDDHDQIKGVISEYDLLLQAATRDLNQPIDFTKEVISIRSDTPLKDIVVLFYKNRVKRIPVLGVSSTVVGIVSRIDLLEKLAGISENEEESEES